MKHVSMYEQLSHCNIIVVVSAALTLNTNVIKH